ncbi:hypothetical protein NLJ89_g8641 [Agrocybe chaxingu]|uniref:Uncharacterized protein n=1 Tax=Agrocybe chaxingu TaxID=84603 RepID=A0A9W8JUV0_9AGAR|nr:hypothetical protein NLJ89_g8641 [Agrocybe chaxingu]
MFPKAAEFAPHDARPTKRRRIQMPSDADGFTNALPKPAYRAPVRPFTSAFDNGNTAPVVEKPRSKGASSKPLSKPVIQKRIMAPVPSSGVDESPSKPKTCEGSSLRSAQELHKSLFLDKPIHAKPPSECRRPLSAPRLPLNPPSRDETPEPAALKQIVPPSFLTTKTPSKPLKPLQQPAVPTPHKPASTKELRTISKTGLGQLNLASQSATEELASILLLDQHPELCLPEPSHEAIAQRGLEMSPEKKGKSTSKLARGSLAARAATYFGQSHTGLVLWQKDFGNRTNPPPSELLATIIKVLHKPIPSRSLTKNTPASPGVALCTLRQHNGDPHSSFKSDHLYRVVFSFSAANSPERLNLLPTAG